MLELLEKSLLTEQDRLVSRRQFLKFSGAVPLGVLAGTVGLSAGVLSTDVLARGNRHPTRDAHHHADKHDQHHEDRHHARDQHHEDRHHARDQHHEDRHQARDHHHEDRHQAHAADHHRNEHVRHVRRERSLHLYSIHTDESVNVVYWSEGRYLRGGLKALNYLMRDHYTNQVRDIDRRLFDLLYVLRNQVEYNKPLHVLSGYRCPSTNAMLREQSDAVASHSLHMDGMAIDIRTPGLHTNYLRKAAVALRDGGVGYYPDSDFVHVDTGPIRYW